MRRVLFCSPCVWRAFRMRVPSVFRLVFSGCARKLLTNMCNVLTNFRASGKQVHDERFIEVTGRIDLCRWVWSRRDCLPWFNQLFTRFVFLLLGSPFFLCGPWSLVRSMTWKVAVCKEPNEDGEDNEVRGDDGLKNSRTFGKTSTTEMAARTDETTASRRAT